MNVADFIIKFLAERGIDTIFMITGGQAMFLNDAAYRNKKIKLIFNHHEQASGMAAEAYGRIIGKLGVAMVTAGPGAINVLSGVVGAWVDSSPMMVISGQSHFANVEYMQKNKIRQYGLQGIYTRPFARHITKYFATIDDPTKILYHLEKAYFEATNGRTGPVWIEVPTDIQRMEVPQALLENFYPPKRTKPILVEKEIDQVLDLIYRSQRPLFLAGQGIRLANAGDLLLKAISKIKLPVVTTRLGIDLVESDNPFFVGRPGLYPDRAANFAVQNADLLICIGARLDTGIVGYDPKDWGRHAKKVVVDVDIEELKKPGVDIDLAINADTYEFLYELLSRVDSKKLKKFDIWTARCSSWRKQYPMVLSKYKKEKPVNSYYFAQRLSKLADKNDAIVVDTSSPFHVVCQTWEIKKGQRFITTGGISTMGYWPSSIGVCLARGRRRTIVVCGDGSLQMNIQELATIKQNKLPVKIFVINNGGYLLIRQTQKTHMGSRLMGESPQTGLWCPDISKIAKAYEIFAVTINSPSEIDRKIKQVLTHPGPVICDVKSGKWQLIIPRIASFRKPDGVFESRPYEDLFPFLEKEELEKK